MHNQIFYGIVYGCSFGLNCLVETRVPGFLATQQKGYPFMQFMHQEDQAVAQDHAIVLSSPSMTLPSQSKFQSF